MGNKFSDLKGATITSIETQPDFKTSTSTDKLILQTSDGIKICIEAEPVKSYNVYLSVEDFYRKYCDKSFKILDAKTFGKDTLHFTITENGSNNEERASIQARVDFGPSDYVITGFVVSKL